MKHDTTQREKDRQPQVFSKEEQKRRQEMFKDTPHNTTMEEEKLNISMREKIRDYWYSLGNDLPESKRVELEHLFRREIALARTSAQSTCDERIKQAVRERETLFQETNIKELVNEMKNSIQEHGDMHGEFCPCNMEDPDACECEEMAFWGKIIQEWMGKVNEMWVINLKNHRKYCNKDGRKDLTKIKSALLAPETLPTNKE